MSLPMKIGKSVFRSSRPGWSCSPANGCGARLRRDNRRARREVEVFGEAERTVQPQFEQLDDSERQLVAALDHLPRDQREVLVMKIWNELTFAEIAEALGISQNTAASRYRYGLAALKKTYQPQ